MEGQEYLNQISASNRPVKNTGGVGKLLSSKFFVVGLIGIVLLLIIIILGSALGGNKGGEKNLSIALKLHLDGTVEVIKEYQPNVKSSVLRSSSASLDGILSSTNKNLTDYLAQKYGFKPKEVDKKVTEQATLEKDALKSELFEAKINGNLDRIYAHKMAYEISMIMSEESKILGATKDENFSNELRTSYESLSNLYENFNDFSETK